MKRKKKEREKKKIYIYINRCSIRIRKERERNIADRGDKQYEQKNWNTRTDKNIERRQQQLYYVEHHHRAWSDRLCVSVCVYSRVAGCIGWGKKKADCKRLSEEGLKTGLIGLFMCVRLCIGAQ